MLVQPVAKWDIFFKREWKRLLFGAIWGVLVAFLYQKTGFSIPGYGGVVLGTAIAILLGFRTNGAYERWWEARKVWGGIVNDSRTLARQLLSATENAPAESQDIARRMVNRQVFWNWALARRLRGHELWEGADRYLTSDERTALASRSNVNTALMAFQARDLQRLQQAGVLPDRMMQNIDDTLTRLIDSQGKCERIKNTVFPLTYTTVLSWCINLFFFLVPMSVVDEIGYWSVPFVLLLGGIFAMIEDISDFIQNPLDDVLSGTSMYAICRTIEIDLLEELGEDNIPEPMKPTNFALT